MGGSPKSRRKEQNQLICDSDKGGQKILYGSRQSLISNVPLLYLIIIAASQLNSYSLATKHPAFYEKHYGHFAGNDETLTEQGRFTLNAICDITDDLKNGIYTTGIDKIDNVSYSFVYWRVGKEGTISISDKAIEQLCLSIMLQ